MIRAADTGDRLIVAAIMLCMLVVALCAWGALS